jgi:putative protease
MKSVMYVAVVTSVYRHALDIAIKNPQEYKTDQKWRDLLNSVSNRHYTEGFYASVPDKDAMNYATSAYVRTADFLGVVVSSEPLTVECRGKFIPNETLELFTPTLECIPFTPVRLINPKGEEVANSRAGDVLALRGENVNVPVGSLLRRNTQ